MAIKMSEIQQKYNFVKSFFNRDKFENSYNEFDIILNKANNSDTIFFKQYYYPFSKPIILEAYRDFTLEVNIFFSYSTNKIVFHYG